MSSRQVPRYKETIQVRYHPFSTYSYIPSASLFPTKAKKTIAMGILQVVETPLTPAPHSGA
jgi:hypothetical protein